MGLAAEPQRRVFCTGGADGIVPMKSVERYCEKAGLQPQVLDLSRTRVLQTNTRARLPRVRKGATVNMRFGLVQNFQDFARHKLVALGRHVTVVMGIVVGIVQAVVSRPIIGL
jgi:hypothetical protein